MKKLKILHLSDNDILGGSAYYAYRISEFMDLQKILVKNVCLHKNSKNEKVLKFEFKENLKFWKNFTIFLKKKTNIHFIIMVTMLLIAIIKF